jgi:hypothetical protein
MHTHNQFILCIVREYSDKKTVSLLNFVNEEKAKEYGVDAIKRHNKTLGRDASYCITPIEITTHGENNNVVGVHSNKFGIPLTSIHDHENHQA